MGFKINILNNEAIITSYEDKLVTYLEIPEYIEGYPVTSLGHWCFNGHSFLEKITIPNSVKLIYGGVFYDCHSLREINIPNSVKYIGNDSFNSCISLININIPNSVDYIGESAFFRCPSLKTINNIELNGGDNIINNKFIWNNNFIFKINYQIGSDYSCDSDIKSIKGKLYYEDFRYL